MASQGGTAESGFIHRGYSQKYDRNCDRKLSPGLHLVESVSNTTRDQVFHSIRGLTAPELAESGVHNCPEPNFSDQLRSTLHLRYGPAGPLFLPKPDPGASRTRLDPGSTSYSSEMLSPLLLDQEWGREEAISSGPQSHQPGVTFTDCSRLRGPHTGSSVGAPERPPLVNRLNQGILSYPTCQLASPIHGDSGKFQELSMVSPLSGTILCSSSVHLDNSRGHQMFEKLGDKNCQIFGRFFGNFIEGESGRRSETGCPVTESSWFSSQSRHQELPHSFAASPTPGLGDRFSAIDFSDSSGKNQRYQDLVSGTAAKNDLPSSVTGQSDWKTDCSHAGLASLTKTLLGNDRQPLFVLQTQPSRSCGQTQLEKINDNLGRIEGRSALDFQQPTQITLSVVPNQDLDTGLYRRRWVPASRVGISRASPTIVGTGSLVGDARGTVSDSSEGTLGSHRSNQTIADGLGDLSSHRLKNCQTLGGSSRWEEEEDRFVDDFVSPTVENISATTNSDRKCDLGSRESEPSCRWSLPIRHIINSRSAGTLGRYEKIFVKWLGWLSRFNLLKSPHSLWLFLDNLAGTSDARYARQFRSAILMMLKISGEFYLPAQGIPPLTYKDERILLVAVGVERGTIFKQKRAPKLPIRWFHLEALSKLQKDVHWMRDMAIFLLGMFAFLRACEFSNISPMDFVFESDGTILFSFLRAKSGLDASKTVIRISELPGFSFSITLILKQFIEQARQKSCSLLFRSSNGYPINSSNLTSIIRHRMSQIGIPASFSSHALRVGAATFAAERGLSESMIKSLGGWKSDAYLRYVRDVRPSFN